MPNTQAQKFSERHLNLERNCEAIMISLIEVEVNEGAVILGVRDQEEGGGMDKCVAASVFNHHYFPNTGCVICD